MKREREIQKKFYVNEKENLIIKNRMKKSKRENFSDYAREILLTGEIKVIDFELIKNLTYEINKIGNNINQIIKIVHENKNINQNDLENILNKQEELEKIIYKNIKEIINKKRPC